MIELMVTVVVGAVLVALAAPSFRGYFVKKKIEGTAAELFNDIQFARAEAVARNQQLRISFGTHCYVIHVINPVPTTVNSTCAHLTGPPPLRTVTVEDTSSVALAASSPLAGLVFDTVRGEATLVGMSSTDDEGSINVTTPASVSQDFRLRAVISKYGRAKLCTPNSMQGYAAC